MNRPDVMKHWRFAAGLLFTILIAFAFGVTRTHAQATVPLPPAAGCTIDIPIPIKATLPDGTSSTTTYTIDCQTAYSFFYQITQHATNAQTLLGMWQYAQPVCVVATSPDNFQTFDRTSHRLRDFNGALYSVSAAGVPYRNAQRLGVTTNVQKLCLYGSDVVAKGQNDGAWYLWQASSWYKLPTATIDTTVLN